MKDTILWDSTAAITMERLQEFFFANDFSAEVSRYNADAASSENNELHLKVKQIFQHAWNKEMHKLTKKKSLPILEKQIAALKNQAGGAEQFVAFARKYTKIAELTPEILNTMIDKIIIGERENRHSLKNVKQKIRILFKGFGELDELMCI